MKKFFLSLLTIVYMIVSAGIVMEIHYCMGKKTGAGLYNTKNEKCGRCGMKDKKGGCCNDEHKFYKLSDSHKNVSPDFSFNQHEIIFTPVKAVWNNRIPSYTSVVINPHSPPYYSPPSPLLLYCTFRI